MKTRTLLILAVTCGLAILLAGAVLLLQLSNQDEPTPPLAIGDTAQVGDAIVTVDDYEVTPTAILITVTLSGVDDADGVAGFTLIAPARAVSPDSPTAADAGLDPPLCAEFTVLPTTCILRFAASDLAGSDRTLLFERAAERVRWRLT